MYASDQLIMDQKKDHIKQYCFKSQEDLDNQVIEIAKGTYDKINKNWVYPIAVNKKTKDLEELYIKSDLLEASWHEDNDRWRPLLVFKGNSISDLMRAIIDAPKCKKAILDCTLATIIVKLIALVSVLGEKGFELYVAKLLDDNNIKLNSTFLFNKLPFGKGLDGNDIYKNSVHMKKGSFCYITNVKDYREMIPNGAHQGDNVVCVGTDQYIGFGQEFKKGPLCEKEIIKGYHLELIKYEGCLGKKIKRTLSYISFEFYNKERKRNQAELNKDHPHFFIDINAINELLSKNS